MFRDKSSPLDKVRVDKILWRAKLHEALGNICQLSTYPFNNFYMIDELIWLKTEKTYN